MNFSKYMTYNPDTGEAFWLERSREEFPSDGAWCSYNKRFAGKRVGTKVVTRAGKVYIRFMFMGKSYLLHRVIWFMVHGLWPDEIDHENGSGTDNRLKNLSSTTRMDNQKNRRRYKNRVLPTGVCESRYGGFIAYIQHDKKRVGLGTFATVDLAAKARQEASLKYGYKSGHGEIRPL